MRAFRTFLSAITAAAVVVACSDRAAPTEEGAGPNLGVSANGSGGNGPYRNLSNGVRADVSWTDGDSLSGTWSNGWLSASRADSLGTEATTVYWYISDCDASYYCRYSNGYGMVPQSVLTASGRGARLVFDPRDYPGQLWIDGDTLGPVDVAWTENGTWSQSFSGTSEYSYPGYRFRMRGSSQTSGAAATGHAGSWVLPANANGSIGTNRNMEMTFYR